MKQSEPCHTTLAFALTVKIIELGLLEQKVVTTLFVKSRNFLLY